MPNQKKSLALFLVCMLIMQIVVGAPLAVFAENEAYNDYSNEFNYPNDTLKEIIRVYSYDNSFDHNEAQQMINRMEKLPAILLEESAKYDARLILLDFPITDMEDFAHLSGEHPRGHPEDAVWDDLAGITVGRKAAAWIGDSFPNERSGSSVLEYHEFAHAIDFSMTGESLSDSDEFQSIHEAEKGLVHPDHPDYEDYPEEFFAEAFSTYHRGGSYREGLEDRAPQVSEYIRELPNRTIIIEDVTSTGISLEWVGDEKVDQYHIYRDDEKVDTIEEEAYTDQTYTPYGEHRYRIEGENKDGEVIYTSLPRIILADANNAIVLDEDATVEVVETTDQTITLAWMEADNADYYEIYRDDVYIDETYEGEYEDFVYASDKEFIYTIYAKNYTDGKIEYESVTARTEKAPESGEGEETNIYDVPGNDDDDDLLSPTTVLLLFLAAIVLIVVIVIGLIGFLIYFFVFRKKKTKEKIDDDHLE